MMVHIVHISTLLSNNNDVIICYRLLSKKNEEKLKLGNFFMNFPLVSMHRCYGNKQILP